MIKLYGAPRTSASRCYWMLEELGLEYEVVSVDMSNSVREHKSPAFLKLNPNGKVPVIVDTNENNFTLWESMAINSYLAEKTKSPLGGVNAKEKALIQQWSLWAIAEFQKPVIDWLIQEIFVPADKKDHDVVAKARELITSTHLPILNDTLGVRPYLAAERFTLADLNVASVVGITKTLKLDLSPWSHITAWLGTISDRPAYQKLLQLRSAK